MIDEIFIERLTKRKLSSIDFVYFLFVISGSFIFAVALNYIPFLFGWNIIFITGVLTIGFGFLIYLLLRRRMVEYEMILTNGNVSITRIVSKKIREELADFSLRDCEYIGSVTSERFTSDKKKSNFTINITSKRKYEICDDNWYYFASMGGYSCVIVFEFVPSLYKSFRRFNARKTMPYVVPVNKEDEN